MYIVGTSLICIAFVLLLAGLLASFVYKKPMRELKGYLVFVASMSFGGLILVILSVLVKFFHLW